MTAARYMPPMCQPPGPDLGDELQQAAEARLRELGTTNPTPTDIARAIAHEEDVPMSDASLNKLWCLHLRGPDDIHAAPSRDAAERVAAQLNAYEFAVPPDAVAVPWPYSARAHAKDLSRWASLWEPAPARPVAAFGPWIPWKPGDTIPHEWILADISSEVSSGYMWILSSQVGTRDCRCIRRYCLPSER